MAIVHPWVHHVRGGEKVFFELARAFPHADLYLLHCRREVLPPDIRARLAGTSFLQRFPFRTMPYRSLLPLLPMAVESLDLSGYDLLLSSASGWTHGVIPGDNAHHVSYVHSPPRYLWTRDLPARFPAAGIVGPVMAPLMQYLRLWDVAAASRVDAMLANSRTTTTRVRRRYGRDAEVVHPPVEASRFLAIDREPRGYLVSVGELVGYKRVDIAIRAAKLARVPLVIAGDGPERRRLEALARGADVSFVGRVTNRELDGLYGGASAFIHAGLEDFGIVTVEALTAGLPVVGRAAGGTAEIVPPGMGVLVEPEAPEAFADAIAATMNLSFGPAARREVALRFSPSAFHNTIRAQVAEAMAGPAQAAAVRAA